MDLQTLRFFVVSADAGSLSTASERLHYAQSNLSSRIKQLEGELGEALFYRHKRGVTLTTKGKLFYDYAVRVLQLSDEAVNAVQNLDVARGQLKIGALEATALDDLPELLSDYHNAFPNVKLEIKTEMNDWLRESVLDRTLDGAFISGPAPHPELVEVPFNTKHLIVVGSANSPDEPVEALLRDAALITFPEGGIFRQRFELLLSSLSLPYLNRLNVMNSLSANIVNICAGIGYGYLPRTIVAEYIERGLMKAYPFDDPFSELKVYFVYRKDRFMDAAFQRFLDTVSACRESALGMGK